jgi:FixJ family two-component response regulator/glycine cleavage system H lipoate-binding protein
MSAETLFAIIIACTLFFILDIYVRRILKKSRNKHIEKEREEALQKGLQIRISQEAPSLKRVEVSKSKARMMCVDDDPVILDSLRKILVLDGFSVDTVESGKEALSLLNFHHYDFVFVDLKMPDMPGTEVTRTVRAMRPDIDVIILTGYGTIESAVDMMKIGVLDYVQKPFTQDELLLLVARCVRKRRKKLADLCKTGVHVASIEEFGKRKFGSFVIPGGVFISETHCWASLHQDGFVQIGIDDFAKRIIGNIDTIEFPNLGMMVQRNQHLFGVCRFEKYIPFISPLSGEVVSINKKLKENIQRLDETVYAHNWICCLQPSAIEAEIQSLKIGQTAIEFFRKEIDQCESHLQDCYTAYQSAESAEDGNGSLSGRIKQLSKKDRAELIDKVLNQEKI